MTQALQVKHVTGSELVRSYDVLNGHKVYIYCIIEHNVQLVTSYRYVTNIFIYFIIRKLNAPPPFFEWRGQNKTVTMFTNTNIFF